MGKRTGCEPGPDQADGIEGCAENYGEAVADTFRDRTEDRLANAPCEILNCNRQ